MNEQELRTGLREIVADSSPPPPMNPNAALDAARRAHKRRRASWAGAAAGTAVVALAAGTVFALAPTGESLPIGTAAAPGPAGPNAPAPSGAVATTGSAAGSPDNTETSWPNGQNDRTSTKGPRADTANGLLESLKAVLPDTLAVDTTTKYPGSDRPVTGAQASFENYHGTDNKQEAWQYLITTAVTQKSAQGTGRVTLTVFTPGNPEYGSTDICTVTPKFWGVGGSCTSRVVQGKTIGVITKTQDARIDNVAGYRYDDGTVVFLAQSKDPDNEGAIGRGTTTGGMTQPPLTIDQLAQLVLTPSFKVQ